MSFHQDYVNDGSTNIRAAPYNGAWSRTYFIVPRLSINGALHCALKQRNTCGVARSNLNRVDERELAKKLRLRSDWGLQQWKKRGPGRRCASHDVHYWNSCLQCPGERRCSIANLLVKMRVLIVNARGTMLHDRLFSAIGAQSWASSCQILCNLTPECGAVHRRAAQNEFQFFYRQCKRSLKHKCEYVKFSRVCL